MNYVVVVLDPVPEDLSAAIDVVAERFRIGHEKARALLARVPGPVTKSVAEQQALTVADILHQAGLRVELRAGGVDGPAVDFPAAGGFPVAGAVEQAGRRFDAADPASGAPAAEGAGAEREDAVTRVPADASEPAVESVPLGSRRRPDEVRPAEEPEAFDEPRTPDQPDGFDEDEPFGDGAAAGAAPTTVDYRAEPARARPEPGMTTTTPPRDPMKTTLTREPPDLERGGLRRRIATAATLPAILTLLVALLALTATLLPVLRAQQASRAADTATAVAATIEGLSGGLPLGAPIIRAELRQVEERTRSQLAPRGVAFMTVIDADGSLLLEWNAVSSGSGSLTPEQAAAAKAAAGSQDEPGAGRESLVDSLAASLRTVGAMLGFGSEELVMASAEVRRNGLPVGSVVVGLDRADLRSQLGQVLLTTLLVGLIPVLFAVLAALSLTRSLTDAVRYLLVATDRISHGDFERPVALTRDDELGQIAGAVERMRVSLRESMERLRRRR